MKLGCDCIDNKVAEVNARRPEGQKITRDDLVFVHKDVELPWPFLEETMTYCPMCATAVER